MVLVSFVALVEHLDHTTKVVGDQTRVFAGPDYEFDTPVCFGAEVEGIVWAKLSSLI